MKIWYSGKKHAVSRGRLCGDNLAKKTIDLVPVPQGKYR
jgi:hypothetical protein